MLGFRPGVLTEAAAVGGVMVAVGLSVDSVLGDPPAPRRFFEPDAAARYFLIGALAHLAFELAGANAYYARTFPQVVPPQLP